MNKRIILIFSLVTFAFVLFLLMPRLNTPNNLNSSQIDNLQTSVNAQALVDEQCEAINNIASSFRFKAQTSTLINLSAVFSADEAVTTEESQNDSSRFLMSGNISLMPVKETHKSGTIFTFSDFKVAWQDIDAPLMAQKLNQHVWVNSNDQVRFSPIVGKEARLMLTSLLSPFLIANNHQVSEYKTTDDLGLYKTKASQSIDCKNIKHIATGFNDIKPLLPDYDLAYEGNIKSYKTHINLNNEHEIIELSQEVNLDILVNNHVFLQRDDTISLVRIYPYLGAVDVDITDFTDKALDSNLFDDEELRRIKLAYKDLDAYKIYDEINNQFYQSPPLSKISDLINNLLGLLKAKPEQATILAQLISQAGQKDWLYGAVLTALSTDGTANSLNALSEVINNNDHQSQLQEHALFSASTVEDPSDELAEDILLKTTQLEHSNSVIKDSGLLALGSLYRRIDESKHVTRQKIKNYFLTEIKNMPLGEIPVVLSALKNSKNEELMLIAGNLLEHSEREIRQKGVDFLNQMTDSAVAKQLLSQYSEVEKAQENFSTTSDD